MPITLQCRSITLKDRTYICLNKKLFNFRRFNSPLLHGNNFYQILNTTSVAYIISSKNCKEKTIMKVEFKEKNYTVKLV